MKNIYPPKFSNISIINPHIKPKVLWMTGLSGSGKSVIAEKLQQILKDNNIASYILDGDNIRNGLNKDLSFNSKDRAENIRRIAEVAKLFKETGIVVIASFITPYEAARDLAKIIIGIDYVEIFVNASLETCIKRDVNGLYKKAIAGEIENFTGISDSFEIPENSNLVVDSNDNTVENVNKCAMQIYDYIINR